MMNSTRLIDATTACPAGLRNASHPVLGLLVLAVAGGLASRCAAQINLALELQQTQLLRNQSMLVNVRIENKSGQQVQIGEASDWLTFSIETTEGRSITPSGDLMGGGSFLLEPSESIRKVIDLSRAYDLSVAGSYRVTAFARFPTLNHTARSATIPFQIIRGTHLWEETCGVPSAQGGPARLIRYSLQQSYHVGKLSLFARIADAEEESRASVLQLGTMVSFSTPEVVVDKSSSLHVLFQKGPREFEYCLISPDAVVKLKETFDFVGSRPRLKQNDAGKLAVIGGMRRPSATAPSTPPPATSNAPPGPR